MPLTQEEIEELASVVDHAARDGEPIEMLTARAPEMSFKDAYRIQRASMLRRQQRDERIIGLKMGLTSRAKMAQMGVHSPIYGHLTHTMRLPDGGTLKRAGHCHPRMEPELAFILGRDLRGPVSAAEAMLAVDGVCCAIEVIDSRYRDFKFTLKDVVADNASSSHFALGSVVRKASTVDIGNLGMVLERNGKIEQVGSSAAILEHPARSLAALANMLAEFGEWLTAGQVVLAGAATKAIHVEVGDRVTAVVEELGTVELRVEA